MERKMAVIWKQHAEISYKFLAILYFLISVGITWCYHYTFTFKCSDITVCPSSIDSHTSNATALSLPGLCHYHLKSIPKVESAKSYKAINVTSSTLVPSVISSQNEIAFRIKKNCLSF